MEKTANADTERIRRLAAELFDSADPASIDRAAQLIKTASEAENQTAQAAKYAAEEKKLNDDLSDDSKKRRIREDLRALITSVTPMVATVLSTAALIGTLYFQHLQLDSQREQAKETLRLQTQAAEDVRWNEAIRLFASDKRLAPAEALLESFNKSERYRAPASNMANKILVDSKELPRFESTFNSIFSPARWDNISYVLEVDRDLTEIREPLAHQVYDGQGTPHDDRIKLPERATLHLVEGEIAFLSDKIGSVMRSGRPSKAELDLSSVSIWDADLQGANLGGAILTSSSMVRVNLKGAIFSQVTKCDGINFDQTAWWEAQVVSSELLRCLVNYKFNPKKLYGLSPSYVKPEEYKRKVILLLEHSNLQLPAEFDLVDPTK